MRFDGIPAGFLSLAAGGAKDVTVLSNVGIEIKIPVLSTSTVLRPSNCKNAIVFDRTLVSVGSLDV